MQKPTSDGDDQIKRDAICDRDSLGSPNQGFIPRPTRWMTPIRILFAVLAFAVLAVAALVVAETTGDFRHLLVGFPTTPMTLEGAERMASEGPPVGSSEVDVIKWLQSKGIFGTGFGERIYFGQSKSAMLQMDNPETTDGERHRPETASLKSLGVP
jgi:hypothetical protein